MKRLVKPHGGHFIQDRRKEIFIGLIFFAIGALLMYDAFDSRGRAIPWPASKFVPW